MKTRYSKLHKLIILAAVIVIVIASVFSGYSSTAFVYADTTIYSDVLDDLEIDENFNVSDYPSNILDYSLTVIQVAESEHDELLIYVYQPYNGSRFDLTAKSVNISVTGDMDNPSYKNYTLTLINQSGTLYKYKVENFVVENITYRYYDISAIYRMYYTDIDGEETGENTTTEFAVAVAQFWVAGEVNGVTYYDMKETEVISVQSYAGYIRYWNGVAYNFISLADDYIDSHYIAFSCDYDIEDLYEADISFYSRSVIYGFTLNTYTLSATISITYGDLDTTYYDNPLTVAKGNEVSFETTGVLGIWGKSTYSWDRICTVDEFTKDLENNEDVEYDSDFIDSISDKQWVLRFYETTFTKAYSTLNAGSYSLEYTEVTDITILRLKFLFEGDTLNLGVVSNKITGSEDPDAVVGKTGCQEWDWYTIISILLLVLLVIVSAPFIPTIVKVVVWIISLPYKLVSEIVKAIKKSSNDRKNE